MPATTAIRATARITGSGAAAELTSPWRIASRFVVPAAPYRKLNPYSSTAEEKMLSRKYFSVASWPALVRHNRYNRMYVGMLTSSSARNRPTKSLAAAVKLTPARISSRHACDSPASSAANWFQLISTSTPPVINVSPRTNHANWSPRKGPDHRPSTGSSGGPCSQSQAAKPKASSDRPPQPCRTPDAGV